VAGRLGAAMIDGFIAGGEVTNDLTKIHDREATTLAGASSAGTRDGVGDSVCGGVAVTVAVSASTSGSTADLPHADLPTCGVLHVLPMSGLVAQDVRQCSNGLSSTSDPVQGVPGRGP
jgi:hypothetical protein